LSEPKQPVQLVAVPVQSAQGDVHERHTPDEATSEAKKPGGQSSTQVAVVLSR